MMGTFPNVPPLGFFGNSQSQKPLRSRLPSDTSAAASEAAVAGDRAVKGPMVSRVSTRDGCGGRFSADEVHMDDWSSGEEPEI